MSSKVHSHHIFLFPFLWDLLKGKTNEVIPIDLEKVTTGLESKNTDQGKGYWKRTKFQLHGQNPANFNEYNYFYRPVSEVLYDRVDELKRSFSSKEKGIELSRHFEYEMPEEWHYHIKVSKNDNPVTYSLKIDKILLQLHDNGTGIISYHLDNQDYPGAEDVLIINQLGRRVYLPFYNLNGYTGTVGEVAPGHVEGLENTKNIEIPEAIWLGAKSIDFLKNYGEDFCSYKKSENLKNETFIIPGFIRSLFPKDVFCENPNLRNSNNKSHAIHLKPVLDDRMFVICWYGNNRLAERLTDPNQKGEAESFERDDWWYRFVFVDGSFTTCQDQRMKRQLLSEHTYSRWSGQCSLYGISRYSFLMLTKDQECISSYLYLIVHMKTLYFRMVCLSLLQRSGILHYTEVASKVCEGLYSNRNGESTLDTIKELYRNHLTFTSKYCFREITAQEQGIELYDLLMHHMRIEEHSSEFDHQIAELYNYSNIDNDKRNNDWLAVLSWLGAFFLPLSLLVGIFGMNTFNPIKIGFLVQDAPVTFWQSIGFTFFISAALSFSLLIMKGKVLRSFRKIALIGSIIIIFVSALIIINSLMLI